MKKIFPAIKLYFSSTLKNIDRYTKYYYLIPISLFLFLPLFPIARNEYLNTMSQVILYSFPLLIFQAQSHSISLSKLNVIKSATLFFGYLFISSFWVIGVSRIKLYPGFLALYHMLIFILLFLAPINTSEPKLKYIFYAAVILAAIYTITCFIFERLNPGSMSFAKTGSSLLDRRINGYGPLTQNPITTSAYISMYIYIGIALIYKKTNLDTYTIPILLSIAVLVVFLYFTGSRSSYLAIVFACIAVLINYKRKTMGTVATLSAIGLINIKEITQRGLSYRPEIWLESLKQAIERPLFGHGYANLINIDFNGAYKTFHQAHNLFIEVFYFGGIFGLIFFMLLLFFTGSTIFKSPKDGIGIFSRLIFIHGLFIIFIDAWGIRNKFSEFNYYFLLPIGLAAMLELRNAGSNKNLT